MIKIFSIDPNSGKYIEDNNKYVNIDQNMYQGMYNYIPIFPLYTFSTNGRFNYMNGQCEVEFYTMLPIKKMFNDYLVEVRFRVIINHHQKESLNDAINKFNEFCENSKKTIKVPILN